MTKTQSPLKAIIYSRCSTGEQMDSHLGIEAQIKVARQYCEAAGFEVIDVIEEAQSGKSMRKRPLLNAALDRLKAGEANVLVSSNVSRLSRSISDLAGMLDEAEKRGYGIVACDTGLRSDTPAGKMVFQILGVAAEYERAMISDRTKKALAAAAARGVVLGRPTVIDSLLVADIIEARTNGQTFESIAADLNAAGIVTVSGKAWTGSVVHSTIMRNGGDPRPAARGPRPKKVAA